MTMPAYFSFPRGLRVLIGRADPLPAAKADQPEGAVTIPGRPFPFGARAWLLTIFPSRNPVMVEIFQDDGDQSVLVKWVRFNFKGKLVASDGGDVLLGHDRVNRSSLFTGLNDALTARNEAGFWAHRGHVEA